MKLLILFFTVLFSTSSFAAQCLTLVNQELKTNKISALTFSTCKKEASAGNSQAQAQLGWMYATGNGTQKNSHQAFIWTKRSADKKNAAAQNNVGMMYENGQGVRYNLANARRYYGLSCDNQLQLGCDNYKRLSQKYF